MAYVIFFLLFPLANSVLDWASLSATRGLMRWWVTPDLSAAAALARYVAGAIGDLVLAVLCVTVLAAVLSAGLAGLDASLVAFAAADPETVNALVLMGDFRLDPFGRGLTVTLMLFSTLVPTVFHLGAGFRALTRLPHVGRDVVRRALAGGVPDASTRLTCGALISLQWLVPPLMGVLALFLVLRFFSPASWLFDGADGLLILELPYRAAEWTWFALGGAPPPQ